MKRVLKVISLSLLMIFILSLTTFASSDDSRVSISDYFKGMYADENIDKYLEGRNFITFEKSGKFTTIFFDSYEINKGESTAIISFDDSTLDWLNEEAIYEYRWNGSTYHFVCMMNGNYYLKYNLTTNQFENEVYLSSVKIEDDTMVYCQKRELGVQKYNEFDNNPSEAKWADPIDTSTGAHTIDYTALSLVGAQEFSFDLKYNSLHNNLIENNAMGVGWQHNYQQYIVDGDDGSIHYYNTPTSYIRYTIYNSELDYDVEDAWTTGCIGWKHITLCPYEDGTYCLDFSDGRKEYFDESGRLYKKVDKTGKVLNITYPNSSVILVEEPISGKYLMIVYEDDKVSYVTDGIRTVNFTYNDLDHLTQIEDANGNTTTYTYNPSGQVLTGTNEEGITYFTDTYDSEGRVIAQDDGVASTPLTKFQYDDDGGFLLVTITNRNGGTRINTFDHKKRLKSVTDENDIITTYEYDNNGNVTKKTCGSATIEYTYDDKDNLLTQTDSEGTEIKYTYDEYGNMLTYTTSDGKTAVSTYDENNRVVSIQDIRNNTTTFTYNEDGLTSKMDVNGREYIYEYTNGMLSKLTSPGGNIQLYEYDSAGRPICIEDINGRTVTYEYDALGNILKKKDAGGVTTTYTYDSRGNKLTETDSKNNTTIYTYDGNNNLLTVTDPLGNVTEYEYNDEGQVTKITDPDYLSEYYSYDAGGRLTSYTDGNGITRYTYDENNNVKTKIDPTGGVTEYTYYDNNVLESVKNDAGSITSYTYDEAWRITNITDANENDIVYEYNDAGDLISVTDQLNNKTVYTYDEFGNQTSVTDPRQNTTIYTYDDMDRLTSVKDPLGNVTSYEYDYAGNVTAIINARGYKNLFTYDAGNRLTASTDALGHITKYRYDANGNLAKITDARGNSIDYEYDERNSLSRVEDALGNETIYEYHDNGLLYKTTDSLGRTKRQSYGIDGALQSVTDANNKRSIYRYDSNGNITNVINPLQGETKYTYDKLNRLTSETTPSDGVIEYKYNAVSLLEEMKNAREDIITYTYDAAGRIETVETEDDTITYKYDENGNVLTVTNSLGTITREYDANNRVEAYTDVNGKTIRYKYDEVGNLIQLTYPNRYSVKYTYNDINQLTEVCDFKAKRTKYEYDDVGNLEKIIRADGSVQENKYDANNRIESSIDTAPNGMIINEYTYEYNTVGEVTVENSRYENDQFVSVSTTMTYDKNNRLLTYNGHEITYDADGNMVSGILSGEEINFAYDVFNRLTTAGNISYNYDAEGTRISKTDGESTVTYVTDTSVRNSRVLMSTDEEGNIVYYIYGLGLIAQYDVSNDYEYKVYHYDMRGSTTALTDADGNITDRFDYDTYGTMYRHTGITETPFLYNGQYGVMTDDNGLCYMRTRYYSPELKRFINADILKGGIEDSRTLNRYAYVNGNPVSYIDPFGTSAEQCGDQTLVSMIKSLGVKGLYYLDKYDSYINSQWANSNTIINLILSTSNYINNAKFNLDGDYEHFQNNNIFSKMRLGVKDMSFNGCEVIATYNATIALDDRKNIQDIAYYYQNNGSMLYGVWGTNPYNTKDYFENQGYSISQCTDISKFDEEFANSKVAILSYWTSDKVTASMHTVALVKNANGTFTVYNTAYYSPKSYTSIEDYLYQENKVVPVLLNSIK